MIHNAASRQVFSVSTTLVPVAVIEILSLLFIGLYQLWPYIVYFLKVTLKT